MKKTGKTFHAQTKLAKRARESAGISQLELSKLLGYSSPQMVSNWERGLCGIPDEKAPKLCDILGIDFKNQFVKAVLADERGYLLRLGRAA